jgi:hypothetical protein
MEVAQHGLASLMRVRIGADCKRKVTTVSTLISAPSHDRIHAQHLCPQILIMDTNFQPIISANARGHYRQHPLEFERALVALSLEPGVSVARIAREHGVG